MCRRLIHESIYLFDDASCIRGFIGRMVERAQPGAIRTRCVWEHECLDYFTHVGIPLRGSLFQPGHLCQFQLSAALVHRLGLAALPGDAGGGLRVEVQHPIGLRLDLRCLGHQTVDFPGMQQTGNG